GSAACSPFRCLVGSRCCSAVDGFLATGKADRLMWHAVDQHELAFDDFEDLAERDFARRRRESVAAAQAAHRIEQAVARELLEQVVDDALVEFGLLGNLMRAHYRVGSLAAWI